MTIDIHGHVTSPALFKRFPMPRSLIDIDGMIERKAAHGITTTIVGSPVGAGTMVPVAGLDNYSQPLDQLNAFHDWVAAQVRTRPGQLAAYVYTNPHGDDSLLEATARRLEQPEFVGLIANTSVQGEFLDTSRADAFFALAAEHRAPILLHPPARPAGGGTLRDPRLLEHVARPGDITTGFAAILFAGWLEKYPTLRMIAPTGGAGLPLLADKLDLAYHAPAPPIPEAGAQGLGGDARAGSRLGTTTRPPSESLRRVYVDTATPGLEALTAAVSTFGIHNVMFGTDSPPLTSSLRQALDLIDQLSGPDGITSLIKRDNAAALFGLDPAVPTWNPSTQVDQLRPADHEASP